MSAEDAKFFLRKRYFVCFLTFTGTMLMYILRTNLSIAIIEMTSMKNVTSGNETYSKEPEFDWDSKTKGFVLSAFSIGYLFGPLGGILSLKHGGVTLFGIGAALTAFLTILSPILLHLHFLLFIFGRILEGILESFSMVAINDIYVYWSPPGERSRLITFNMAGASLGIVVNYPLSGYIAHHYGWETVFYFTGGLVFVWYFVWLISVTNDPITDRLMTQKERNYFKSFSAATFKKEKISVPWKMLFTSKPFWAYVNEFFSSCWSISFLVYCLPLYVKDAFNTTLEKNGALSAIPAAAGFLGLIISPILSDYLRNRGKFSKPFIHRAFIATAHIVFVILMIYVALFANLVETIICFSLEKFIQEFAVTSYYILPIDMFGKYAGVVRGFGVTATSVAFFLNPILMGIVVSDHSLSAWKLYFLFLCVFNVWSLIIYYLYGSGEQQEWVTPKTEV